MFIEGHEGLTLKGVLIDFGGTLAHLDEAENRRYEEALASTLNEHGYMRHSEDLHSVLAGIYVSSTTGELNNLQEFWTLVLKRLRIPGQSELIRNLEKVRTEYAVRTWKLYDGVSPTLRTLKKKFKMALVSNCAIGTDKLIDSLHIAQFFSCIILSYQIGARKPDKRIYLEALKCLRLDANECVFVADEISDLEGAREIEMKTMLVRQGSDTFKEAKDCSFKPNYEFDNIADITKFL